MTKIIKIEKCIDCQYYYYWEKRDSNWCCKENKDIISKRLNKKKLNKISSWCPLEDLKE